MFSALRARVVPTPVISRVKRNALNVRMGGVLNALGIAPPGRNPSVITKNSQSVQLVRQGRRLKVDSIPSAGHV